MTYYSHLSYDERVYIGDGLNNDESFSKIVRDLNRSHSTEEITKAFEYFNKLY